MKLKVLGLGLMVGLLVIGPSLVTTVNQGYAQGTAPQWTPLPTLPTPVGDGAAFILTNDLYYAGGWPGIVAQRTAAVNKLSVNPLGAGWESASALPTARFGVAGAFVNGHAYAIGGYDGSSILNRVDSFNGTAWRSETEIPTALNFTAAAIVQGRIYVAGGLPGPVANVWSTGINTDGTLSDWRSEIALPRGLITRMAASETCLYIVGGGDSSTNPRAEIYRATFDAGGAISAWSQTGALLRPLAFHAVAIDQNILYVLGGETTGGALNDQVYSIGINPNTCDLVGEWESSPLPGGGNRRLAVASRFGELYVLGGQTAAGYTNAVWKGALPVPAATLTFHKSAALDGDFGYGKLITYTLSYANPWVHPDGQTGVVITDTLPVSTTLVSATPGYVLTDTNTLRWDIGALAKDASGAVTFTVQITPAPALEWSLQSAVDYHPALSGTATLLQEAVITYRIAYTPTGDAATDGILLTATLPAQLFPLRADPSGISYAVQGQHVVWRIPGVVDQPGYAQVVACVLKPFSTQELLTYTAMLEDVLGQTKLARAAALQPEVEGIVAASCTSETLELGHPTAVPALYPDLVICNQAWICSNELGGCQPSNETVTRALPLKTFLPLVIKQ